MKTDRASSAKWLIWGIMLGAYAINFFHAMSMGVVKDTLMQAFALRESTYVVMVNAYSLLLLLMQLPTGILVDTLGPRLTAASGMLVSGCGVFLFSMSHQVTGLVIGRGLIGLGISVIFISILKLLANWFTPEKFGTLTGVTCFVGGLGGAFAQAPFAALVGALGWRSSFQLIGGASLVIAVLILLLVKNAPAETAQSKAETPRASLPEILSGAGQVLRNRRVWPPFVFYAIFYGSYLVMMGLWGTGFLSAAYQISSMEASAYITVGVIGSAVGAAVIGDLSDRIKSRRKPLILSGGLYLASWVALITLQGKLPLPAMGVLLFINGFMSCAYVISWPVVKECNRPEFVGVSTSVANMGGFLGSIVLPYIAGGIFDRAIGSASPMQGYLQAFGVTTGLVLLGFVVSLFTCEIKCQNVAAKESVEGVPARVSV